MPSQDDGALTAAHIARALRHSLDPVAWAEPLVGFKFDPWQVRVLRSKAKRILINVSRQAGKSTVTALLALHIAIHNPKSLILIFSKAQRQSTLLLAKIHEFYLATKDPSRLLKDSETEIVFANKSTIVSLPGDGTTIRGFSAPTVIVCDEAGFVSDELFDAFLPMMANGQTRLIALSTPNGRQGYFYQSWVSGSNVWQRESVCATEIPHISAAYLDEMREEIGPAKFSQEFMCCFVDAEGQFYSGELIERAFSHDLLPLDLVF